MSDPGYDFFATGRPTPPPGATALPEPPTAPPLAPPSSAPAPTGYGAPAPSRTFQMPNGAQVNQFGTPVGEAAAPTGPYAAPGVAAVPTAAPGMVSTWGGPPVPVSHRAASPQALSDKPPRNVRAVAILATFGGVLGALATLAGVSSYQTLGAQLDRLGDTTGLAGSIMTALLVGLVILFSITVTMLTGGIATLAGQRWGGWILVVAFGLSVLGQLQSLVTGGFTLTQVIVTLIAVTLLLVLVTGEGLAWILGRPTARR